LSLGGDSISDNSDQDDAAIATRKRIHQMDMSLAAAGSFDHIICTLTPAATAVRAKQAAYHQAAKKKKKKAKEDAKVTAAAAAAVAVAVAVATADPREEKQSQPKREGKTPIISIPAISSSTVVQPPAPAPVEKCISSDHRDHLILIVSYLVSLSFYVYIDEWLRYIKLAKITEKEIRETFSRLNKENKDNGIYCLTVISIS
jgi:hypothetical protein